MATIADLPATAARLVREHPPTLRRGRDGVAASDAWRVPLDDLPAFLTAVEGVVEDVGGVFSRVVPLVFQDFDAAVATAWDVTWRGWDQENNRHAIAIVRIDYESPDYDEEYRSVNSSPDSRTVRVPASTASGYIDIPVGGQRISVTLHKLPGLDLETWRQYGGYINSAAWRGFPAETVLFEGPTTHQATTFGGTTTYDVTLQFRASRLSWREEYDATGALVDTGVPPSVDFASVLGA